MKKSTVILILSLLALLGGCAKEALKTTYDKQAGFIEGFISTQMKTDTNTTYVRRGGAYRLTLHDTLDRVLPGRDTLREGGKVARAGEDAVPGGGVLWRSGRHAVNEGVSP